ncbi:MAG: exodeoxyribonuclease I [Candidatus Westeberhardia cardiocondylae]|nr:exodeoxyribonuclease I [Candidatus Westeberhardia cardiocondylae]
MKETTFVIYDYEMFGKNPTFDKPAQFSSIRINKKFEQIEKTKTFFCRLPIDYFPDPEAVLITGITPQKSFSQGIKELDFAKKIYHIFNTQKTCIVGYNNISFDDEITRNIFYRNFYDPYSWHYKNFNTRWDLLNIMRAYYAICPKGIQWPINKCGAPSFQLKKICMANNIKHNNPHDSTSDVYATLELLKLAYQKQPKFFKYLYNFRKKQNLFRIINFNTMQPLIYISGTLGNVKKNATWIAPLIWYPENPNILISCDLNENIEILKQLNNFNTKNFSNEFFNDNFFKKGIKNPLKLIYINKCPILLDNNIFKNNILHEKNKKNLIIDNKLCTNNFIWLKQNISFKKKLQTLFKKNIRPYKKHDDVDKQLYEKFFNKFDKQNMNTILKTKPENLSKLKIQFSDKRIKKLLFRYKARNFPNILNNKEKLLWSKHCKKKLNSATIKNYVDTLKKLQQIYKLDIKKKKLLNLLSDYFKKINSH